MDQASVIIGGVTFLSHTWPLVFGLPSILILAALVGLVYELTSKDQ